jgi:hypothetical protein
MVRPADRFSRRAGFSELWALRPHLKLDQKGEAETVGIRETLRKNARVLNYIAFQAGWFTCVWGAGQGMIWLGPLFVTIVMCVQAGILAKMTRGELYFLVFGIFIGLVIDTGMILAGVYDPVRKILPWPLAPVWIIALWVLFTGTFNLSLQWLHGRPLYACLLGALAAPMSYAAGQRLGAATMDPSFLKSYVAFGVVWGITVPALFALSSAMVHKPAASG